MSVTPLPRDGLAAQRPGGRLASAGPQRVRRMPTAGGMARRRAMVTLTKWLLPIAALALLGSIAAWPELMRVKEQGRVAFRRAFSAAPDSTRLTEPRYRGTDDRGRPYVVTADWAAQAGEGRVDLSRPKGDVVPENGGWLMVQSLEGVYLQRAGQLDLSKDVVLYRDDGTVLTTQSAAVDVRRAAAAGSEMTHAEGPFGVLDAQGFTLLDKGDIVQFHGPARLVLNGANR